MFAESASAIITCLLSAHPPVGCIIDCSGFPGIEPTPNTVIIQTHDGKAFRTLCEYGDDPVSPRTGFKLMLSGGGFEYEMLGEFKFFVRGTKFAPLTRVRIKPVKPGDWAPKYYFVWTEPRRLAPPPRTVQK